MCALETFNGSILFYLGMSLLSCGKGQEYGPKPNKDQRLKDTTQYINPVFTPLLADPTVIQDPKSGYFYAYGTEDYWSTDKKTHVVAIIRSKDLTKWDYIKDAFSEKPAWKTNGGIWAPDINYIDSKYYLYYSYSIWADPNPGIGLAIATDPIGPFIDQGKLFYSDEVGIANAIDPFYFEDSGKKYLFVGSYSADPDGGIYGIELSDDGKSVPDFSKKFKIAAPDFEGAVVFKRKEYYYFIGSKNNCCDGANSVYELRIGRSKNLKGPYVDANGNNITDLGKGTLILERDGIVYAGPGHCSRIFTDKAGTDWILYHAIKRNNAIVDGVNQRALMLDQVNWDAEGWPKVHNGHPSVGKQPNPKW